MRSSPAELRSGRLPVSVELRQGVLQIGNVSEWVQARAIAAAGNPSAASKTAPGREGGNPCYRAYGPEWSVAGESLLPQSGGRKVDEPERSTSGCPSHRILPCQMNK